MSHFIKGTINRISKSKSDFEVYVHMDWNLKGYWCIKKTKLKKKNDNDSIKEKYRKRNEIEPDILILCNESKIRKFLITIKIITYFIYN